MPDQLHPSRLEREVALDAYLIEGELPIVVEILLGGQPASGLVVVDLPEAVARDGEPVHEALEPDPPPFREGEHHQALHRHRAVTIERVVTPIVGGEELFTLATVVVGRSLRASDLDKARPRAAPALVVALEEPIELGNLALPHAGIELFQGGVHVAAHEHLRRRHLRHGYPLHVLEVVLPWAGLVDAKPRVGVHGHRRPRGAATMRRGRGPDRRPYPLGEGGNRSPWPRWLRCQERDSSPDA